MCGAMLVAEQIAPWMCPVLQADNECKMHLLPLAMSSPLVFDAVAAAAYHRLAYYGNPHFASKAEHYKASAIRGLITSARSVSASSSDQLFAAATLLILMYDEMIAAQDTFITLARIIGNMRKFVDFSSLGGSEKLQRYLTEQFGFLTIFSLPHRDDDTATEQLRAAFNFVEEFAASCARDKHNPPFLAECFRTILTVWHGQKHNNPSLDVNLVMEDFKSKIEATSDITVFDHYLTWVYFMSSAASPNASLRFARDISDTVPNQAVNGHATAIGTAKPQCRKVDVAIIGGGFSGCYLLHKLRKQNFSAVIIEAASGLGGVWQWNCYPGARVDTPVPLYEYSMEEVWRTWNWTEKLPTATELQKYFEHVDNVLDLSKDVIYNTKVTEASFDDATNKWTIHTDKDIEIHANWFVPAVGFAAKRSFPDWPGLEDFQGVIHHSSFWPRDGVDLRYKRVAVVGTGSTGVQIVQEVGPQAKSLVLFQRTPNLALPLNQAKLTKEEQEAEKDSYPEKYESRLLSKGGYDFSPSDLRTFDHNAEERRAFFQDKWAKGGFHFWTGAYGDLLTNLDANREAYSFWSNKIRSMIRDPVKREMLAPSKAPHPFGTKRPALFRNFYQVCDQDNVSIVDVNKTPVTKVLPNGIVTADGAIHEIDALVLATGFDAITGGLKAINIANSAGETLLEKWSNGTWTNLGLMTADFPNMFFMYGPQGPTALSNGPTCVEIQGDWIVRAIGSAREAGKQRMRATVEGQDKYRELVNGMTADTLFPMANSYYMGANIDGKPREALNFPGGIPLYRELLDEAAEKGYDGFVLS
ncbi:Cyclopentanone 12-monooxygenase [Fusarium acutatum]|uniref:Cyclopentanone 12-monooxygenase n=1 Tax=Fusarium acutatum TaxID=78861 RepID=A0A8H4JTI3_9HYPO|nr:Cyclopentanone 12-monooxygenase [Fusarium acutatum]